MQLVQSLLQFSTIYIIVNVQFVEAREKEKLTERGTYTVRHFIHIYFCRFRGNRSYVSSLHCRFELKLDFEFSQFLTYVGTAIETI